MTSQFVHWYVAHTYDDENYCNFVVIIGCLLVRVF